MSRPERNIDSPTDCGKPTFAPSLVDVSCSGSRCSLARTELECIMTLTLVGCSPELPPISLALDDDGKIGAAKLGDQLCDIDMDGARTTVSCPAPRPCVVRFFEPESSPFEIERVAKAPIVAEFRSGSSSGVELLDGYDAASGWIGGAAVRGEFLAIVTRPFVSAPCIASPSAIRFLSAELGTELWTSSAAPCLSQLVPTETGFLGLSEGRAPLVTGLDAEGRESWRVGLGAQGRPLTAAGLVVAGNEIFAVLSAGDSSTVVVVDAEKHVELRRTTVRAQARDAVMGASRLILTDRLDGALVVLDPETLEVELRASLGVPGTDRASDDAGRLLAFDGRALVTTSGRGGAVFEVDLEDLASTRAQAFAIEGVPWAMGLDGSSILVGLTTRELDAHLGRWDSASGRFEPWTLKLGRGVVRDLLRVNGAFWAVLPWEGTLVRLRAR
ncbi:MAG: hypothetical protein HYV07_25705 [Deltaproteobacteria bacterium]|nr:hypothetical protein [Deltaproteobacteria bacterium]